MGLTDRVSENAPLLYGWRRGAAARPRGVQRVPVCGALPLHRREAHVGLLILRDDAVDEPVHGDIPGEDDEAGALRGDEGQREALNAAALFPALHGHRAVPLVLLAWQHRCIKIVSCED